MIETILAFIKVKQFFDALSNLQGPDWFAIFFAAFGVFYGMRKGMIRELVEIVELMTIIFLTFAFYQLVLEYFSQSLLIASQRISPVVFLLGMWVVWIAVAFLDKLFQPYFQTKLPNALKTIGGAILGAVHFFLIWCFLSQAVLLIPSEKARVVYEDKKSLTGPVARELPRKIYQSFTDFLKMPDLAQA